VIETVSYDKQPCVDSGRGADRCFVGWKEIGSRLVAELKNSDAVLCIECYPGVFEDEIELALKAALRPARIVRSRDFFRHAEEINNLVTPLLGDDPVFGSMNDLEISDLLDQTRGAQLHEELRTLPGVSLVIGTGATLLAPFHHRLVYADLPRWEAQQRQRRNAIANLAAENFQESPGLKYKRAFFLDWRAADRLKRSLFERIDFLLDTTIPDNPKMIAGIDFLEALAATVSRPFRVVPFFDPGPWGGQWMKRHFDLDPNVPNFAWCFDCVPEENSLLLGFGHHRVEVPSIDAVFYRPEQLLGPEIYRDFGAEFPIRFDLLDTMEGGNLSLQVHPLASYIREHFGMTYTQDESYYVLDAAADASVYLGLRESVSPSAMARDLRIAQEGGPPFAGDEYVNRWPARKHDHFLIPGGTVHCSGRNSVVLEISATPYIFTFKLWDWGRLGLDGRPRPIHLEHGLANIQWNRTENWVRENLINRIERLSAGDSWREERTGLHKLEFIENRRHWFTGLTPHDTGGSVNVLNLVEGDEIVVESPAHAFEPFVVHYAETFIVPASVGPYTIRPSRKPHGKREYATVKASVRSGYKPEPA
jgi:mannose-6-phosphate isomerase class I